MVTQFYFWVTIFGREVYKKSLFSQPLNGLNTND